MLSWHWLAKTLRSSLSPSLQALFWTWIMAEQTTSGQWICLLPPAEAFGRMHIQALPGFDRLLWGRIRMADGPGSLAFWSFFTTCLLPLWFWWLCKLKLLDLQDKHRHNSSLPQNLYFCSYRALLAYWKTHLWKTLQAERTKMLPPVLLTLSLAWQLLLFLLYS